MNQFVPDWNMGDTSRPYFTAQKKPLGQDNELIELLWCNGHVVMQSQTHRKSPRAEPAQKAAPAMQEDEAAPWFPYALQDSLEKDLFSELFYEMPAVDADKFSKEASGEEAKCGKIGAMSEANVAPPCGQTQGKLMPPPKSHATSSMQRTMSLEDGGNVGDLSDFVMPRKADAGKQTRAYAQTEAGESSMLTIGSSICGSNQVQTHRAGMSDTVHGSKLPSGRGNANANANAHEATVASSSGRSNCSFERTEPQSTSNRSSKRKERGTEESESPSEDVEFESAEANKPPQRPTTSRRTRAAEVHNLSERRRRDRINEKMKALQELIPHCNKTDKASMLDEAIEYLKSLQLQVQMMWMGSGMGAAPMIFPGIHQYIPRMGIGMSPPMPYLSQPIASNSAVNQTPLCPPLNLDASNFPHPMPAVSLPGEPYAHYLGFNHLQPPSQGMSFYPFGAKTVQQNPTLTVLGGSLPATTAGALSSENTQNNTSG